MDEQQGNAGEAFIKGAAAAQFFNLPVGVVTTAIGSVVGVVLMLLFAYFVLANNGAAYNNQRREAQAQFGVCSNQALAQYPVSNPANYDGFTDEYTGPLKTAMDACQAQLTANGG